MSRVPKEYYQGVTSDPRGNLYFDGIFSGLYRTDSDLHETARNDHAIPSAIAGREGYNHIGDISWSRSQSGRLLLPLSCHRLNPSDTIHRCKTAAIGVADPKTLAWRYYVRLDPREIPLINWVEESPDGKLIWTSSKGDLLAFRSADVTLENAAPAAASLKPVMRLPDVVPIPVTGGTFIGNLLLVAGPPSGRFGVWSIDVADGSSRIEIERRVVGESEGLDFMAAHGGVLHWQIGAHTKNHTRPTYGFNDSVLLHYARLGPCFC